MQRSFRHFLLLAILAIAPAAFAGNASGTSVQMIVTNENGQGTNPRFLVTVSGTHTGRSACATIPSRFAIDLRTEAGKEQVSLVKTAHALGVILTIIGTGACEVQTDSETMSYVLVGS